MIALRIIDELPCRPVSQPKLFGYSIYQTQTTDVSVVQPVTQPNRQDMTPPAFLFLSSTMSISPGKALPNQTPQTQNHAAPPLRAVPAVSHPKHLKSAKVQRRQPAPQSLSHRAYRCHTQYLSSTSSTFLRNREEISRSHNQQHKKSKSGDDEIHPSAPQRPKYGHYFN